MIPCKILPLLVHFLSISPIWGQCVFFSDCPAAEALLNKKKFDPETITIFQNSYCGEGFKDGRRQYRVHCDKIPPEGCVPFNQCPAARDLVRTQRYSPETIRLLKASVCGENIRRDLVLCQNITQSVSGRKSLFSDNCGLEAPDSKIFAGEVTKFEDYPWLALLQYRNESGHLLYRCHGSLISKRYVITAAHCLRATSAQKRKSGELYKIISGEYNTDTKKDCIDTIAGLYCIDPPQEFSPESIQLHPNFATPEAAAYDIALIRLDKEAVFSDYVRPICLPREYLILEDNEILLITGWGSTETSKRSPVKLKAEVNFVQSEDCSGARYDSQMCAGSTKGADTCQGDSGGPLMVRRRAENREFRTILVGVVSHGGKCGRGYGIYTNVAWFMKWITETMKE